MPGACWNRWPSWTLVGWRTPSRSTTWPAGRYEVLARDGITRLRGPAGGGRDPSARAFRSLSLLEAHAGVYYLQPDVNRVGGLTETLRICGPWPPATRTHFGWDLPYARRMLDPLAELDARWLENPIPIDDLAGYEVLARDGAVPLAAGESERTRFPFISLLDAGVYYLQPDVNRVGGLTETLRICALAASHQRPVTPHQGWLHSWHLIAARANCPVGEYFPRREPLPGNALIWAALTGEPEADEGFVTIPEAPGFGWTLNPAGMAPYADGAESQP